MSVLDCALAVASVVHVDNRLHRFHRKCLLVRGWERFIAVFCIILFWLLEGGG